MTQVKPEAPGPWLILVSGCGGRGAYRDPDCNRPFATSRWVSLEKAEPTDEVRLYLVDFLEPITFFLAWGYCN